MGKSDVMWLRHSFSGVPGPDGESCWPFLGKWCDGGEGTNQRKSGTRHLAAGAALWPRLAEMLVGHMNNEPSSEFTESTEPLADVLHTRRLGGSHERTSYFDPLHHQTVAMIHFTTNTAALKREQMNYWTHRGRIKTLPTIKTIWLFFLIIILWIFSLEHFRLQR